jgi:hypothetical protein
MSYVTVEELQKYSNVHEDSALSQNYIDSAENIVENYLGYSPLYKEYSSLLDGNGTKTIGLKAKPIQALLEVIINDINIPVSNFIIENEFIYSKDILFFRGKKNIKINYFAGYNILNNNEQIDDDITDGGNAFSTFDEEVDGGNLKNHIIMPDIIKMTVLRIATILQAEADSNIAVSSKSFGDSGTRVFINYTDYSKYLVQLSNYKLLVI